MLAPQSECDCEWIVVRQYWSAAVAKIWKLSIAKREARCAIVSVARRSNPNDSTSLLQDVREQRGDDFASVARS